MIKRIGLIGCGNIGGEIARAIDSGEIRAELIAIFDVIKERAISLQEEMKNQSPVLVGSVEDMISMGPDLIVEAASQKAVKEYGPKILKSGISLMIMSVGALLDEELRKEMEKCAEEGNSTIYIPVGAIAGLDAIRALRRVGINEIKIRTRKNPRSLAGAPYLKEKGIELESLREPMLIYEGKATEAVKEFPANVNVSASLSIAAEKVADVEVWADPEVERNVHEIVVESDASKVYTSVQNVPSPRNPKTSYLAVLSAIEALREICSPGRIRIVP